MASWRPRGRLVQLCHFWRGCFATGTWRLRSLGVHASAVGHPTRSQSLHASRTASGAGSSSPKAQTKFCQIGPIRALLPHGPVGKISVMGLCRRSATSFCTAYQRVIKTSGFQLSYLAAPRPCRLATPIPTATTAAADAVPRQLSTPSVSSQSHWRAPAQPALKSSRWYGWHDWFTLSPCHTRGAP